MNRPETSELLRRAAEGLGDTLRAETRRRLVSNGLSIVRDARQARFSFVASRPFALAAGAAVAMVAVALVVPSLLTTPPPIQPMAVPGPEAVQAAATPVRDLSVVADGERVVLNWNDGGAARKVFRATSHAELSNIRTLPARTVTGETWIDEEPPTAPIVYYVIE